MKSFHVKNFERFQHYKDRAPPWIKLYNELLDDYEFGLLPDASKMHLIAIWLLASRSENKIPLDEKWVARRINASEVVNLQLLAERGFIIIDQELQEAEQVASKSLAECLPREREETEESREETDSRSKPTEPASRFDEFWQCFPRRDGPNPRKPAEQKFNALVKTGVDPQIMIDAARKLAADEQKRGNIGTRFIAQAATWLNQTRWIDHAAIAFEETAQTEIDWDAQVARFKRGIGWSAKWYGPEPGQYGCRAPPDVLAKYGYAEQQSH